MSISKIFHAGNVLLAGFGGMLIMMSILVYLSIKQDITMVSNNYYEQELQYQHQIDARANTLSYRNDFSLTTSEDSIVLQLPEQLSQVMSQGKVHFYCPSNPKLDRVQALAPGNGIYHFDRSAVPADNYVVKISFTSGDKDYYHELKTGPQ